MKVLVTASQANNKIMQLKLSFKPKLNSFEPCLHEYELSPDLVIWAALDLEPSFSPLNQVREFYQDKYAINSTAIRELG